MICVWYVFLGGGSEGDLFGIIIFFLLWHKQQSAMLKLTICDFHSWNDSCLVKHCTLLTGSLNSYK